VVVVVIVVVTVMAIVEMEIIGRLDRVAGRHLEVGRDRCRGSLSASDANRERCDGGGEEEAGFHGDTHRFGFGECGSSTL